MEKLYQYESGSPKTGSTYYAKRLIAGIKSDATINVAIGQTYEGSGGTKNIDIDAGGGVTQYSTYTSTGELASDINVTISGNENTSLKDTNGYQLEDKAADILVHEMVGHAIPAADESDTGNAIENENKVRKQVKEKNQIIGSPLRAPDSGHLE